MRIIAGTLKGRRLETPDWDGLRPTSDKLRETLFNILAPRIAGARVLDGYAGTGAVGIEALSRGAAHVTFVDSDRAGDRRSIAREPRALRRSRTAMLSSARIWAASRRAPFRRPRSTSSFSIRRTTIEPAAAHGDWRPAGCAPDGVLVLEHARRRDGAGGGRRARARARVTSGDSALAFYRRAGGTERPS